MSDCLRGEYEKYLDHFGLKPRKLPSRAVREAGLREMTRIKYEEARSRDDPMAEEILVAFETNRERYLAETRHPTTIRLEEAATEVETTIGGLEGVAGRLKDQVYVGEFPTGSVEAQTVKVDGGYLILVNSGLIAMLQQVVTFLWRGDPDDPEGEESLNSADGIGEVLAYYVQYRDPFYGPKPLLGGMRSLGASLMTGAATKFVIAHEYGHILAGHLAEPDSDTVMLKTEAGEMEVLSKNHAQEMEADDIGYRLTLGVEAYSDFKLSVIDVGDSNDPRALHEAARQKCLLAAPFVPLTVDLVLARLVRAMRPGEQPAEPSETHPSAEDRIERLLNCGPGKGPQHRGFINFPFMMLLSMDRIVKRIGDRISGGANPISEDGVPKDDAEDESWFDRIMRCVDALRAGDLTAATLAATDAAEEQRTFIEADGDVVLRELIRAALGRPSDIKAVILKRHRDQRAIHSQLRHRGPMGSLFGGDQRGRLPSHEQIAAILEDEKPKGLGLVWKVLKESTQEKDLGVVDHLLRAVLAAWAGGRERAVSQVEASLRGGLADDGGRMARFLELERRALKVGLPLDLQAMLVQLGSKAIGDKGGAMELARLVKDFAEEMELPLGPMAQRMVDVQLS